ncbi:unnamed protein product [Nippostrongylus brasiliensis]|uniref:Uncharacterized protein n=1 Tax=Nippostrongylus brasiliensis TaxID=27835 RepID=A0A0N4Y4R7_NIPBR|nr:unnamed protein product [Nippostrongylus brasiliensis]
MLRALSGTHRLLQSVWKRTLAAVPPTEGVSADQVEEDSDFFAWYTVRQVCASDAFSQCDRRIAKRYDNTSKIPVAQVMTRAVIFNVRCDFHGFNNLRWILACPSNGLTASKFTGHLIASKSEEKVEISFY